MDQALVCGDLNKSVDIIQNCFVLFNQKDVYCPVYSDLNKSVYFVSANNKMVHKLGLEELQIKNHIKTNPIHIDNRFIN